MGGFMMWPLALVSIAVAAIIIERFWFYSSCRFPDKNFPADLEKFLSADRAPLLSQFDSMPMLREFGKLMISNTPHKEAALAIEGDAIVSRMERYLPTLGVLARLAPLMGLLGTVLGMISTFSEIANANTGINMNQLAGGIWQALITTAAGLAIAIPALFFLHQFQSHVDAASRALTEAANSALVAIPAQNDQ